MFKSAVFIKNRINFTQIRLSRHLQTDQASYLLNPGREPLTSANLGQVLEESVKKYADRIAIKSIHEDLSITYEDLLKQADSLGHALRQNGFEKGDRFGIWTHNCAGWIVATLAAARAGLISVLINPLYEKPELSYCINKAELKGILIGDEISSRNYYSMMEQIIPELEKSKPGQIRSDKFPTLTTVVTAGKNNLPGTFSLHSLSNDHKNNNYVSQYVQEIGSEDGSIIHFTSGTTGNPKAGLDSHLGLVNNTYYTGIRNSFNEGHQIVCVQVPLFHALGSVITTIGGLRNGVTLVLAAPTYNVAANIKALCSEKCTAITGTPTMYVDIISQIKDKGDLPIKLKMALAAGAPCSPQLIHQIEKHLKADSVRALYGMTETTASVFQSLPTDGVDLVAETVGYLQDHVEVQVVDQNGQRVPYNQPGELMVRGYLNMLKYWNDPEKTKQTLTHDGWLHTGDTFTISPDGYGRIVGRIKDIIVRGGENIAPKEIEDLLNTHPDIIESQVVGVADERLGEELCAVLRTRENVAIDLQDIRSFCSGKIARFKIPRIIKTLDEFPKTVSGKIQKFRLKQMIDSGKL
ncbi:medium-chain acyl-CoA ligase ACSF2, mitochondrial [Zerene cesonia]|uniref:medium-chain acyl-CoA ligase ACSF2, mitochondrial n=1 Tax=Zerene cesonia TaxID=33412 RepID=UPI0018E54FE4|nr:medium-chain acyl-CoA ligase ACSF2, mitochondrial [Zerene cesonia]